MIESEVFEQLQTFLYRPWVSSGAEGTQSVVVGDTFEQHLLTIDLQSEGR